MTLASNNCLNANNSTVPTTSAHETCTRFIAIIGDLYPQLRAPRFRLTNGGRTLSLRARHGRRSIFACGPDFNQAMRSFTRQCLRKVAGVPCLLTSNTLAS